MVLMRIKQKLVEEGVGVNDIKGILLKGDNRDLEVVSKPETTDAPETSKRSDIFTIVLLVLVMQILRSFAIKTIWNGVIVDIGKRGKFDLPDVSFREAWLVGIFVDAMFMR